MPGTVRCAYSQIDNLVLVLAKPNLEDLVVPSKKFSFNKKKTTTLLPMTIALATLDNYKKNGLCLQTKTDLGNLCLLGRAAMRLLSLTQMTRNNAKCRLSAMCLPNKCSMLARECSRDNRWSLFKKEESIVFSIQRLNTCQFILFLNNNDSFFNNMYTVQIAYE